MGLWEKGKMTSPSGGVDKMTNRPRKVRPMILNVYVGTY